jgi:hypothetical protein
VKDKTCLMTGRVGTGYYERFTCSECAETRGVAGDKFCAHCGAEIIRFVRKEMPSTIFVECQVEPAPKPRTSTFFIETSTPAPAPAKAKRGR